MKPQILNPQNNNLKNMQKLKNKKEERGRRANFIIQSMIKFLRTYPYIEIAKEQ
jgi:hypothetical protein